MVRIGRDSTNMDAIPADTPIVFGYPHAFSVDYSRFPNSLQVWIDQHGNHADDCHVADCENGAIGVGTIRQWVESWHLLHPSGLAAVNGYFLRPTVYASESNIPAVRAALVGLAYDLWGANWSTGEAPIPGTSGKQYMDSAMTGGDYDQSVFYDDTWGVSRPQPPQPVPGVLYGIVYTASPDLAWTAAHARVVVSGDGGKTWR